MQTIIKLVSLLSVRERKRASLLMGLIIIMALLDMLGVASILPFIAVLANPELLQTNVALNTAFKMSSNIGIHSQDQFLFALGLLVFLLLVMSLAIKAITNYAQTRFALMREYSIGSRLLQGYLHQNYIWFLSRNSAELTKSILSEIDKVVNYGLLPLMALFAQSAVALALMTMLILVDPILAFSVGLVLGLDLYMLSYFESWFS